MDCGRTRSAPASSLVEAGPFLAMRISTAVCDGVRSSAVANSVSLRRNLLLEHHAEFPSADHRRIH